VFSPGHETYELLQMLPFKYFSQQFNLETHVVVPCIAWVRFTLFLIIIILLFLIPAKMLVRQMNIRADLSPVRSQGRWFTRPNRCCPRASVDPWRGTNTSLSQLTSKLGPKDIGQFRLGACTQIEGDTAMRTLGIQPI